MILSIELGRVAFILPFFLFQFVMPSGILDHFGVQTEIQIPRDIRKQNKGL